MLPWFATKLNQNEANRKRWLFTESLQVDATCQQVLFVFIAGSQGRILRKESGDNRCWRYLDAHWRTAHSDGANCCVWLSGQTVNHEGSMPPQASYFTENLIISKKHDHASNCNFHTHAHCSRLQRCPPGARYKRDTLGFFGLKSSRRVSTLRMLTAVMTRVATNEGYGQDV